MRILIKSIKQTFLISSSTTIFVNGIESAWLGNGEQEIIEVEQGENNILIKSGIRQKNITFISSQDVTITIKWNRISGAIEALVNGPDVKVINNK